MDDTSLAADLSSAFESASAAPEETSAQATAPADETAQLGEPTIPAAVVDAATSPSTTPVRTGPIPFDVHKTALENARTKAREEYDAENAQYAWARQVDPTQFQEMVGWYQRANADPVAFAQELISSLQAHPQHGAQLRSMAAKALASARGQGQAAEPQMVNVQLEDGSTVAMPRNPAEWLAYHRNQWSADIEQKFAPLTKTVQTIQQREAETAARAQADTFAGSLVGNLSKLPGFNEHKADIAKFIAAQRFETDHPSEVRAAALEAYAQIVVPKLDTTARRGVLNDIHHKAGATTHNPANVGTAAPKSYDQMSIAEALRYEASRTA